ncbi:hypothetical protein ACFX2I_024956 [Malus domestica]
MASVSSSQATSTTAYDEEVTAAENRLTLVALSCHINPSEPPLEMKTGGQPFCCFSGLANGASSFVIVVRGSSRRSRWKSVER